MTEIEVVVSSAAQDMKKMKKGDTAKYAVHYASTDRDYPQ
ncbi:hypothetical protein AC01_4820 [Escherichia coli 1-392-07_S3_C1]|nr:hypothetical protein AC57_5149 [Escherichia coli 1-392-07_S3_C3]KDT74684.1 hypothetical protein AB47_4952 [Escherichia coli 3-373-03_S1_C2]KDU38656.1 hypothetical protein AB19_5007 [Escherichia coli 3-373-03_S1_C1]KDU42752.1 hypothetical protein AB77_1023 [Escherichia coli 3-373-03_S1_C3]KDW48853.1 hypothetical protein AC29_4796 [Escherichia coli 1-392-07_S3_C2]KDW96065.1 hypothetical protein AC01_4820 [Escherichia coli 1-392-07_S3_C1]